MPTKHDVKKKKLNPYLFIQCKRGNKKFKIKFCYTCILQNIWNVYIQPFVGMSYQIYKFNVQRNIDSSVKERKMRLFCST